MKTVHLSATSWSQAVAAAVEVLASGGVVAMPTETVYGLMTGWHCETGRERIFKLKARPADKRLQMLALDLPMAVAAGVLDAAPLRRLSTRFWPGALTVVVPAADGSTIGLRLPEAPFVRTVLERLGGPLAATSANRSGHAPACTGTEAVAELTAAPDLLIDGGPVGPDGGIASTVVSLCDGQLTMLRAGPISAEALRRALEPA